MAFVSCSNVSIVLLMRTVSLFFSITLGLTSSFADCVGRIKKRSRPERTTLEPDVLKTWVQLVGPQSHLAVVHSPVVVFTGKHHTLTVGADGQERVLFSETGNFVLKSDGRAMIVCVQPKRQRTATTFLSEWDRVQSLLNMSNEQKGIDYLLLAACMNAKTAHEKKRLLQEPTLSTTS